MLEAVRKLHKPDMKLEDIEKKVYGLSSGKISNRLVKASVIRLSEVIPPKLECERAKNVGMRGARPFHYHLVPHEIPKNTSQVPPPVLENDGT